MLKPLIKKKVLFRKYVRFSQEVARKYWKAQKLAFFVLNKALFEFNYSEYLRSFISVSR